MGSATSTVETPRRRRFNFNLEDNAFHLLILIICAFTIFPFLWMLSTSVKVPEEVFTDDLRIIPNAPTLRNFPDAFNFFPVGHWIWNSFGIAVITTAGKLFMSVPAAFAF